MKLIRRLFKVFIFAALITGWTLAASAVHVILTPDPSTTERVIIIPKDQISFEDTFVDTRKWTLADAANHPKVVQRLIDTGKADRIAHVLDGQSNLSAALRLTDALLHPPATQPAQKSVTKEKAVELFEDLKDLSKEVMKPKTVTPVATRPAPKVVSPPAQPSDPPKERSTLFPE